MEGIYIVGNTLRWNESGRLWKTYQDGDRDRMCIMDTSNDTLISYFNGRYVQQEYLLTPPNAEEKPIVIKEPRGWFWQRSKKEDKKE